MNMKTSGQNKLLNPAHAAAGGALCASISDDATYNKQILDYEFNSQNNHQTTT